MSTFKSFEEIESWQKARILSEKVFEIVHYDKFSRDFELVKQINKSSGSIMDNIAEGFERGGNPEFLYFLHVAKGSCGEVRSQLYRSLDRKYISIEKFEELRTDCRILSSMILNLINYLQKSSMKGPKYEVRNRKNTRVRENPET